MSNEYLRFPPILHKWPTVLLVAAIGLLLGVGLSFLRPLEYTSTVRLLITQRLGAVDAYTASRSAERIADDLASIIYTSTFFDKVMYSNVDIDESYFSGTEQKKREKWEKSIVTSVSRNTGLLSIKIYHTDTAQAEMIAMSIAGVLEAEGWNYTSGGNLSIQMVDEPLNSRFPARPNILMNGFSAMIIGAMTAIGFLFIEFERKRRRHQLIHEE
ncbi:hypothetical protein KJ766_04220 [Patescibacteria group bacterium]|nr:hypothetical protein [Patescibacteria group bacterium]